MPITTTPAYSDAARRALESIAPAVSAGERTRALGRRTLYETTACSTSAANGPLRLNGRCLRFSYSHAALLDANVGATISRARQADATALRALHADARATTSLKRGAPAEMGLTITTYAEDAPFLVDSSLNAGQYNRIRYNPEKRRDATSNAYPFPGAAIDPSGAVLRLGYRQSRFVDLCANVITADMCLNKTSGTALPAALRLRRVAESVAMDVCFAFPARPRFDSFRRA